MARTPDVRRDEIAFYANMPRVVDGTEVEFVSFVAGDPHNCASAFVVWKSNAAEGYNLGYVDYLDWEDNWRLRSAAIGMWSLESARAEARRWTRRDLHR